VGTLLRRARIPFLPQLKQGVSWYDFMKRLLGWTKVRYVFWNTIARMLHAAAAFAIDKVRQALDDGIQEGRK